MAKLAVLGGPPVIPRKPQEKNTGFLCKRKEFSDAFCAYMGSQYALGFGNGTSAIRAALIAAGVEPGDEVIIPSFTWPASVNPILQLFAIPVFADIDAETFTVDPEDVRRKITPRTKVIMPVDIYGQPSKIHELLAIAREHGLLVVEDACQATGAEIAGRKVGSIADITAFSFSGKPITSTSGGALTTDHHDFYERALVAGEHTALLSGLESQHLRETFAPTLGYGYKARLDPHAGDIALEQLRSLDARNDARIQACRLLSESLSEVAGLTTPRVQQGCKHVFHLYTLIYDDEILGVKRDVFQQAVQAEGLRLVTYMNSANYMNFPGGREVRCGPMHWRPVFQQRNLFGKGYPFVLAQTQPDYSKGSLPVTEWVTDHELNIEQYSFPDVFDERLTQSYIDCISKVVENIDELAAVEAVS